MKQVISLYNDLPQWSKGVVVVGTLGILTIGALSFRKKIMKDANRKKNAAEVTYAKKALTELAKKGIRPTFDDTQYESFSAKLVSAFDDCGTDNAAVYGVFDKMKNIADILKLIAVYDRRKFKGCFSSYFDYENLTLSGSLSYEMTNSEISKINSILSKKGINYNF